MNKVNLMRECNECTSDIYHEKNAVDALKLVIRATLLSQLPVEHSCTIENFYETALKKEELRANGYHEENCRYCFADIAGCTCISSFYDTNRYVYFFLLILFSYYKNIVEVGKLGTGRCRNTNLQCELGLSKL